MIPSFVSVDGAPWAVLPPGIHYATLAEVEAHFAFTPHRRMLFNGLCAMLHALQSAGCSLAYLDGGYTTSKPHPKDFDGCWDPAGVVGAKLDPVLLDSSNGRSAQTAKYGGEMMIATTVEGASNRTFLDFFQTDRFTGERKGIVGLRLGTKGLSP